jgi:ATP-dependent exoDNAse (exonuclease V) beta subunit
MGLCSTNDHPRDDRIRFEEDCHRYFVDGSENGEEYTSTTRMVHSMFKPFDADEVIARMMKSKTWTSSKYFGMSVEEIKEEWDTNRNSAAKAGTMMHKRIETFFDDGSSEDSIEFKHFLSFVEDHTHLVPYRTEWCIFDEDVKVCGSVDMVYRDTRSPGCFVVVDWKRSKAIRTDNRWQSGTSKHTCYLPDCNFSHYSLQLEIYKYILEKKYGLKITETFFVVLHPSQTSYIKVRTRNCRDEVEGMMRERIISSTKYHNSSSSSSKES